MIVTIHQPNFFPYYGYFNKIKNSDIFVFLDNVTFSKNGFINRNTIKTEKGAVWITVPVVNKNIINTEIKDVMISGDDWKTTHKQLINKNYKGSKNIEFFSSFLNDIYTRSWDNLSKLNIYIIKNICNYINIDTEFVLASELKLKGKRTELLADICEELGADTYLSGVSGKNYLDEKIFLDKDIKIIYQKFKHPEYKQLHGDFIPNLSILDMLFNTEVII